MRMGTGLVTVFGGSGFLGRHVVKRLAVQGALIRVAVRAPQSARFLQPMGGVGQISIVPCNVRDNASVVSAVRDARAVVNLVGILAERGRQRFPAVHGDGAGRIAAAAREAGAERLVHVSAIGADPQSHSVYSRTKAEGEARVREEFPAATILRPSVLFGPGDEFFNRFAAMARVLPMLPLFGGGEGPSFQPVYAGDVAEAILQALLHEDAPGRVYELGGPAVMSMHEVYRVVLRHAGRRRGVISLPWGAGGVVALASAMLPLPVYLRVTRDQLRQLRLDNVVAGDAFTLADLGITSTPIGAVVPGQLARFARAGGRPRVQA
jgi:NADH dehydrogenase